MQNTPPIPTIQYIPELLLPHRFCLWGLRPIDVEGMPEKNRPLNIPGHFPFPLPDVGGIWNAARVGARPGERPILPPPLKFIPLTRQEEVSTLPTSRTNMSSVLGVGHEKRLHTVRFSGRLWTALVGFAVGPNEVPPVGLNESIPPEYFSTFRLEDFNHENIPHINNQWKAVRALWWWFLMHLNTLQPLVTCEQSIQDEVHRQLLYPIDLVIQTRYPPNLRDSRMVGYSYMPKWSRPVDVARVHKIGEKSGGKSGGKFGGKSEGKPGGKSGGKSGIPDFILYTSDKVHEQSAVLEVKTWWSYIDAEVSMIWSRVRYTTGGMFSWQSEAVSDKILKQIWAEMYSFDVKFGVWTNGKIIFAALNTSHDDATGQMINELTLSRPQNIHSDNYIYQGLAGLSFASIECRRLDPAGQQAFIDRLCPPEWRHLPEALWPNH